MLHSWGGPFGIGAAHMMRMGDRFEEQYHCYSMAYADKAHLEVSTLKDAITNGKFVSVCQRRN